MNKIALYIHVFIFTFINSFSQTDTIIEPVEEMPIFEGEVGGGKSFFSYIHQNLKYPEIPLMNVSKGTVIVEFTVDTIGQVTNIIIVKSLREDYDREAINAIVSSPKWTPGKVNGKPVNVRFRYPIVFYFENNDIEKYYNKKKRIRKLKII